VLEEVLARTRRDGWLFTSYFLKMVIGAPAVGLRAFKMLVWSEA
jgi:hypothetical protein